MCCSCGCMFREVIFLKGGTGLKSFAALKKISSSIFLCVLLHPLSHQLFIAVLNSHSMMLPTLPVVVFLQKRYVDFLLCLKHLHSHFFCASFLICREQQVFSGFIKARFVKYAIKCCFVDRFIYMCSGSHQLLQVYPGPLGWVSTKFSCSHILIIFRGPIIQMYNV